MDGAGLVVWRLRPVVPTLTPPLPGTSSAALVNSFSSTEPTMAFKDDYLVLSRRHLTLPEADKGAENWGGDRIQLSQFIDPSAIVGTSTRLRSHFHIRTPAPASYGGFVHHG